MKQYRVTGMSCAACQARVEKAVSGIPGVSDCSVSLLTNTMGVEGEVSPEAVIQAVEAAGYGASLKEKKEGAALSGTLESEEDALKDRETPELKKRLQISFIFLALLLYASMGHMMWGWPLPRFFHHNPVGMGLLQMLLSGIILVVNRKFFVSGFRSLFHASPNMDTLIALGSGAAFLYSTVMLFAMTRAQADGDSERVMRYAAEFYFESAAMILTLITVGKMLEAYAKGRTTDALRSLMRLAPKTATVIRDGKEETISADCVKQGDLFVVRPGEQIPADGVVLEGMSAVNEAALTGESLPVDKEPGDQVSSATLNQSGYLKCRAVRVGEDSTLAQIIQMVSDAAATKAPVARAADRISGVFVPVVLILSLVTTALWLWMDAGFGLALARGISVLVVSCPCALGLATPVAIMVGNGVGARNGILFKHAEALQETGAVRIVALDKTGTITTGKPEVTDLLPADGVSEAELLQRAYVLEQRSEHPLAGAIVARAEAAACAGAAVQAEAEVLSDFRALPGNGVTARSRGKQLIGGNASLVRGYASVGKEVERRAEELADAGKTPIFFAEKGRLLGVIAVADAVKEDSEKAISDLRAMGLHTVMLTGDNRRTAEEIGRRVGVEKVIAGVLPDQKEAVIRMLQRYGKVAMVGDGINDAPALTRAEIGIAIGAGTDVAMDAADVVLMRSALSDVPAAIRLSRGTYRNILENLFWALFYNTLLIPAAAGLYLHPFGIAMSPVLGAAAMSLSSFCVVMNALRLNWEPIQGAAGKERQHRKRMAPLSEEGRRFFEEADAMEAVACLDRSRDGGTGGTMKKQLLIRGMMCGHCEVSVKQALEQLPQVEEAAVNYKEGTAMVSLKEAVADEVLKKAVEDRGYHVTEIRA